jgi:Tol biopolymer transport system component
MLRILDIQNGSEKNLQLPRGWLIIDLNWAPDGNDLVAAIRTTKALIVQIDLDGKTHILFERQHGFVGGPCLSPDGRYLAYYQENFNDNIWLLENF